LDINNEKYAARMREVLNEHYYAGMPQGYLETECGKQDLHAHVRERYRIAARHVVPWLSQRFDLSSMSAIEVGSGTGSSTLALAEKMKSIDCYELYPSSRAIASARLGFWGIGNVEFHATLFDEQCDYVRSGGRTDAVLLYATLEHMTAEECLAVLALSWRVLRSHGILIVAETPNRFCMVDHHTSWLPFFSQLPREIQVLYAPRSPREDFRQAIAEAGRRGRAEALEAMTRWGSGISFHEFELAIGNEVHSQIVLDGYEPEITSIFPVGAMDSALQALFEQFRVSVNRAFTRSSMFFVVEKP
jgi:ubiquinone/menaquinone biosynthesis C-methylase UbiE